MKTGIKVLIFIGAIIFVIVTLFVGSNIWLNYTWFSKLGYLNVFIKILWTKIGLWWGFFAIFVLFSGLKKPSPRPTRHEQAPARRGPGGARSTRKPHKAVIKGVCLSSSMVLFLHTEESDLLFPRSVGKGFFHGGIHQIRNRPRGFDRLKF